MSLSADAVWLLALAKDAPLLYPEDEPLRIGATVHLQRALSGDASAKGGAVKALSGLFSESTCADFGRLLPAVGIKAKILPAPVVRRRSRAESLNQAMRDLGF